MKYRCQESLYFAALHSYILRYEYVVYCGMMLLYFAVWL